MSLAEPVVSTPTYDLANPGKRLAGYVVDMAVVFFLLFLKSFLMRLSMWFGSGFSLSLFQGIEYFLTLLALAYFLFCDALPNGQSLGKRLFKMSVVGFPYGPPCSLFQSVLRNVPKALFSMLDGVFVFFGYRRRLGDMLARTVVINLN
ncbi:RDD family protein [Pseudomonas yamanorum]|uniref:RDD family protein n=1 Tax=Pseudomonas yamanorum TaxID=515393 RepID=A0A7Y8EIK6_9PSED|nr:RDD family protein [Pseudomonas yamanorum]NVZ81304.1 RDD family protein [Pseudomonas yamanorum]NWE15269.1 RDD family protein [Pseudomonas yamanorum]